MGRKKVEEPQGDANETPPANGNGQAPRKVVKKFTCQSGKDTHIVVEVVESEFQTQAGEKVSYLSAVCSRTYAKNDGEVGVSYSYRQFDIPVLSYLLTEAHAFILSQRTTAEPSF